MSKIAVFFGTGYEEIEALTVVDLCRRAGIETEMVSITDKREVTSSHHICVKMDKIYEEVNFDELDMIVLPGGLPGTTNLEACEPLMEKLDEFKNSGKWIAAICAAPSIFGHRGYLKGKDACSYPSFESHLEGANVLQKPAVVCENMIMGRGMGAAVDFSLAIVANLIDQKTADNLAKAIVFTA